MCYIIYTCFALPKKRFSSFAKKCESSGIPKNNQDNFKCAIQQIEWDNILFLLRNIHANIVIERIK